jgi:hypothetical protein
MYIENAFPGITSMNKFTAVNNTFFPYIAYLIDPDVNLFRAQFYSSKVNHTTDVLHTIRNDLSLYFIKYLFCQRIF